MTTLHQELTALAAELLADHQVTTLVAAKQIAHAQVEHHLRYAAQWDTSVSIVRNKVTYEQQREQREQQQEAHHAKLREQIASWQAQIARLREERKTLPSVGRRRADKMIDAARKQIETLSAELGE